MITTCQRWRDRRDSYRPAGETIRTADYEVVEIPDDRTAKRFVLEHHYSGTYPSARFRFGLYRGLELAGVAVFSVPCNDRVLTSVFPVEAAAATELGRFVLLDDVAGNGETWFLGRCFEQLRAHGIAGVVSFSDPLARRTADGAVVFGGHVGTIYQAHNACYLGRGTARTLRVLPNGAVLSDRAIQKIRGRERGWMYAVDDLVAAGAPAPGDDLRSWLKTWLPQITRPLRHAGNHKYAWALEGRLRKGLSAAAPYPKQLDIAA